MAVETAAGDHFWRIWEGLPMAPRQGIDGHLGRFIPGVDSFDVEEIPAYPLEGSGCHLFVWLQKQGLPTSAVVQTFADVLSLPSSALGSAGLKDAASTSRQWISIPMEGSEGRARLEILASQDAIEALAKQGIQILACGWHPHKLKTGHLVGNRFVCHVEAPDADALDGAAWAVQIQNRMDAAVSLGVANTYGGQRFGNNGQSAWAGLRALHGILHGGARMRTKGRKARFELSALQALIFNRYVQLRSEAGALRQVCVGDWLRILPAGGMFCVGQNDVAEAQTRLDAGLVAITGPMPGPKMSVAEGVWGEVEAEICTQLGVPAKAWPATLAQGTRRAALVFAKYPIVRPSSLGQDSKGGLQLGFALPAGSFANVFLADVLDLKPKSPRFDAAKRQRSDVADAA